MSSLLEASSNGVKTSCAGSRSIAQGHRRAFA
jgi:hypothetical protein